MMHTKEERVLRPAGMRGFTFVWSGQVVSLLGSGMTWFALTIWAWELTGQATAWHWSPSFILDLRCC